MRSKAAPTREIKGDIVHNSTKVTMLINRVMINGKKTVAAKQVYKALELVAEKTKKKAAEVIDQVIYAVAPQMEVRSRRVGGAAYQVPMPVRPRRASSLAIRWLIIEATKRPNKTYHTFAEKLAAEMLDALDGAGGSIQKRDTTHRMAEANKAFAHFRW